VIIRGSDTIRFDFEGLSIRDYTAGRDGSSSLAVVTVPPGARHPLAYSERSGKYYYVAAGAVRFTLDGRTEELATGDACVIPHGVRFSYVNESDGGATLVLLHTPPFDSRDERFVEEGR
jgi:mannose-6-phosphate isomerase-like protein (cupin superfamily)